MNLQITKISHALRAVVILMVLPLSVFGQGGVGSSRGLPSTGGGIHTIQGKVYFPPQPGLNRRVKVRLDSSNFISQTVQTDDDGGFRFNQLEAGPYTITVEGGKDFENAVENVAIDREASNGGRIVSVPIFLKPKPDSSVPAAAVDAYHKAQQAERSNNHKKAIEQLNAALLIDPNFLLALSELGSLYLKSGDMTKAAETYTNLTKIAPADVSAQLNLGIALFNLKKIQEAETHLREAVKLNDKLPTAHYYLGVVLVNLKQFGDAEKELELAIANGGDNLALAHKFLGGLYISSKKNQQAVEELKKYLALDPKAPDAERIKKTISDLGGNP
jgi:tetratricopeptide (TPR) repeat protein